MTYVHLFSKMRLASSPTIERRDLAFLTWRPRFLRGDARLWLASLSVLRSRANHRKPNHSNSNSKALTFLFIRTCQTCCFDSHLLSTNRIFSKMAEEEDFAFDATDAGASATIPMEAGQIKKGGYVLAQALVEGLPISTWNICCLGYVLCALRIVAMCCYQANFERSVVAERELQISLTSYPFF